MDRQPQEHNAGTHIFISSHSLLPCNYLHELHISVNVYVGGFDLNLEPTDVMEEENNSSNSSGT